MSDLKLKVFFEAVTDGIRNGINEVETRFGTMKRTVVDTFTSIQALIVGSVISAMIVGATHIARGFDVINASIKTATKGLQDEAIPALKQFAKTTPYDLAQVSEAFVKLVNFGLTPSEAALTSYGNTAYAMGKNLNQMVEAVADAVTGEFERLKEFGIKSKVEGDNVIFTFQGVKTTVKNNAADIEKYLIRLGEVNFAAAMGDATKTLDGALSNLGDSWDGLVLTVMKSGFSDFIAQSARSASESLDGISNYIESGKLQANIATITVSFDGMAKDVTETMGIVTVYIEQQFSEWGVSGTNTARTLTTEFQAWLNNTRSFIKIATVEAASAFDKLKAYAKTGIDYLKDPMGALIEIASHINGIDLVNEKEIELEKRVKAISKARQDSITLIIDEHNAQKEAAKGTIDANEAIIKSLEKEAEAHRKNEGDRLAKFKIGSTPDSTSGDNKKNKEKSPKPPIESEIHAFDYGLEQKKIAFEKSHALLEYSKQDEKKYWDDIIANYHGNAKTLADLKKKSADLELQIIRDTAKKQNDLANETLDAEQSAALDTLSLKEATSQQELDLGNINQAQHLANLRQFAAERLAIEEKYLDDKRKLLGDDALAYAQNLHQKEALERVSAAKIKALENQETLAKKAHFKELFAPVGQAFRTMFDSVIRGQQTLGQAIKHGIANILLSYADAILQERLMKAANWAWEIMGFAAKEQAKVGATIIGEQECTVATEAGEAQRSGITMMGALKAIHAKAASAAAAAWDATVGIPVVGPVLAPIAAGAAYVGVMAFGALVGSARGGEWQVDQDGSPYLLHKRESVLPEGVADNFRKVVSIVKHHVSKDEVNPIEHMEVINRMIASGQLKPLTLPDFAINMVMQSQAAANDLAKDRMKADKERFRNPETGANKSGDQHIHIHGIALAPEDFFKKYSKHVVKAAQQEIRKFNKGDKT